MTLAYRDSAAAATSVASTSISVTCPATVQVGDLMVLFALSTQTVAWPSGLAIGWAVIEPIVAGFGAAWARFAQTGDAGSTVTINSGSGNLGLVLVAFSGAGTPSFVSYSQASVVASFAFTNTDGVTRRRIPAGWGAVYIGGTRTASGSWNRGTQVQNVAGTSATVVGAYEIAGGSDVDASNLTFTQVSTGNENLLFALFPPSADGAAGMTGRRVKGYRTASLDDAG